MSPAVAAPALLTAAWASTYDINGRVWEIESIHGRDIQLYAPAAAHMSEGRIRVNERQIRTLTLDELAGYALSSPVAAEILRRAKAR